MADLVRQTLTHLLLPLLAVGGVLAAVAVVTLPLWLAFECGRRARRRSAAAERARALHAYITARATQRATEQAAAAAFIEADGTPWLEIGDGADSDEIDPASLAVPDECSPHPSRSTGDCRDMANEEHERDRHAPLPVPSLTVASPDELLAALFQGFRADVPSPMRAQPDVVVTATRELIGEILDSCLIPIAHPGRRNAERAVLMAMAFSAAPSGITRN